MATAPSAASSTSSRASPDAPGARVRRRSPPARTTRAGSRRISSRAMVRHRSTLPRRDCIPTAIASTTNSTEGTLQADLRFAASGRESFLKFGADRYKVGLPAHRQVDASANVDLLSTDRRGATTPNDYSKRDGFHVSGGTTLFLPGNSQLILDVGYREKQDKASLSSFLDTTLAGWSFTPRLKTGSSVWGLPGSAVAGVDYFVSTYDSDRANNEAAAATPDSPAGHPANQHRGVRPGHGRACVPAPTSLLGHGISKFPPAPVIPSTLPPLRRLRRRCHGQGRRRNRRCLRSGAAARP